MTTRTLLFLSCLLAAAASAETKRVAIVVGNNAGNGDLPPLRYAESDAGKMARMLVEIGDVSADDVLLLQGRPMAELERALSDAKERVQHYGRSPDVRTIMVFYFSGHSDGEGLEMGQEKLAFNRLKAMLAGIGAEVRVAIVDACRSGAGLKEKGAKPTEAFTIKLADTLQTTGEVFITSSAADEAALESSEVAGSYFTHNFISGLRGAADASGDRLVTLSEAYRYAYDRTVAATSVLAVGGQHPNFDFKLSGQGELVLASLQRNTTVLVLPDGADRSLVTDVIRDQVVVEVPAGPVREVALPAGNYGLRLFKGGQSFGGKLVLAEGQRRVVKWDELVALSAGVQVAKKGPGVSTEIPPPDPEPLRRGRAVGLSVGAGVTSRLVPFAYGASSDWQGKFQLVFGLEPLKARWAQFGLFNSLAELRGELAVFAAGELSSGTSSAASPNEVGGQVRLVPRVVVELGALSVNAGLGLGMGLVLPLQPEAPAAAVFAFGPRVGARFKVAESLALDLQGELAFLGVPVRDSAKASAETKWFPIPTATLGLVFFL